MQEKNESRRESNKFLSRLSWSNIKTERNLSQKLLHFIVQVQHTCKWWYNIFQQQELWQPQRKCFMFLPSAPCSPIANTPFFSIASQHTNAFPKHKFLIASKCHLNADLEQVKLPFEEGILMPKEALAEELNYSWTVTSSPKAHTQTTHIEPLPELPTTANLHCNHPLTLHTTVPTHQPTPARLLLTNTHLSGKTFVTGSSDYTQVVHSFPAGAHSPQPISILYPWPSPEAPSPKTSQRNSAF